MHSIYVSAETTWLDMHPLHLSNLPTFDVIPTVAQALIGERVTFAGMTARIPGPRPIRLSIVLGNLRMQRMLAALIFEGDTVVDVGANIGYNTLFASKHVGESGRVLAIEPAQDNLRVLYENLYTNNLRNVHVLPYAAARAAEIKQFFLRGEVSAVNSMYQDNFYHPVTSSIQVYAAPLDDLVPGNPSLIKIDVEGGELEVLQGMTRILTERKQQLIIEWHATLQEAAGHAADALPRHLLALGFRLHVMTHTSVSALSPATIPTLTRQLLEKRSPVELIALRD